MKDTDPKKRRRRRSCYDRLRMRMIERRRMARTNPAQSAAQQLLALLAVVFGRVPVPELTPVRYTPPPMSPHHAQRLNLARRLGVPSRYVDIVLSQGMVPYTRLFDDIRRGGTSRRDALAELRKRVPEASLDWLDHIQRWSLWAELLKCHVPRGVDEDTDTRILKSTLAWIDGKGGGGGTAGASPAPKPNDEGRNPPTL
ncbi:hypothetical protein [Shinella zoogloeoides]|uniref:hypothetical protein n=1 Tax=Shinella zoogloeoides TaxID=352475 RepID=UPI0028AA41A5|nr:hypothetical protein [Shinella zoogloeoides]